MLVDLDWYAIIQELDKCVKSKCLPNLTLIVYTLSWTRLYMWLCVLSYVELSLCLIQIMTWSNIKVLWFFNKSFFRDLVQERIETIFRD